VIVSLNKFGLVQLHPQRGGIELREGAGCARRTGTDADLPGALAVTMGRW